jgi:peptidoglycan/LPS O-acetylase OafA/YrhL
MNKETLLLTVTWTKRVLGVIAFLLWVTVIFAIATSAAPFTEQAPYCMGSTMLIFGVLTAAYKGLDYWSLKNKP